MPDKYTIQEFSQIIKKKYPAYKDRGDEELVSAWIKKYPVYKSRLITPPQEPTVDKKTVLSDREEEDFQKFMTEDPNVLAWKDEFRKEYGQDPDIEISTYDYRLAWKDGDAPELNPEDGKYHWGSVGKSVNHPTAYKNEGFRTVANRFGKPDGIMYDEIHDAPAQDFVLQSFVDTTPDNTAEYIAQEGMLGSMLGKVLMFGKSFQEEAERTTGGAELKRVIDNYQENFAEGQPNREGSELENLGAFVFSMALDAPVFGAFGKLGMAGANKTLQGLSYLKRVLLKSGLADDAANQVVSKAAGIASDIFRRSASSSTALAGHSFSSGFLDQLTQHDIQDIDYGELLKGTGRSARIGAALGPISFGTATVDRAISEHITNKIARAK